eukprot:1517187-Rhodomonas_salina.1
MACFIASSLLALIAGQWLGLQGSAGRDEEMTTVILHGGYALVVINCANMLIQRLRQVLLEKVRAPDPGSIHIRCGYSRN